MLHGATNARNTRGKAAIDDDFFGREAELAQLHETLRQDNVLLLAPRRVGKTSLMHALMRRWREAGDRAVFVDVQGATSEIQFVRRFAAVIDKSGGDGVVASAKRKLEALRKSVGRSGARPVRSVSSSS